MFSKTKQIIEFITNEFMNEYNKKETRDTSAKLEILKQNSKTQKEINKTSQQFNNKELSSYQRLL